MYCLRRPGRLVGLATPLTLIALTTGLSGCTRHQVPIEQFSYRYNEALQVSSSEQLLLNLLRLKYREPTYFLQAGNLTTSLKYTDSVQVGVGAPGVSRSVATTGGAKTTTTGVGGIPLAPSVDVGSSSSYAPTVVMSPILGDDLVHMYLREVDQPTLAYLLRAGWDVRRLFHLCVERIGLLVNDPRSGSYARFHQLVLQFERAQDEGFLMLGGPPPDGSAPAVLSVGLPAKRVAEHVDTIRRSGDLAPLRRDRPRWIPVGVYSLPAGDVSPGEADLGIHLVTRSFHDILCFVAQGIRVPDEHLCPTDGEEPCAGVVDNTGGRHEVWLAAQAQTGQLLDVHHSASKARPERAAVAVQYRGMWFYVDDTDASSKKTFTLLHKIFELQSGDAGDIGTVLTIPVSAD